ncbi:uncharacterized protein LOC122569809 [Bombus pyrosoma]|uniref:uncharacterized protein LOC122569809 n=1 Tax=Bombus pyrosoma TaxID=396416 RepID=UPI001CB9CE35|nr:uncharacterized protein LOC122569809 [Bombus pyrosoma]
MFAGFVSRVPFDSAKPPTFVVYNSHVLVRRSFTTENKMIDSYQESSPIMDIHVYALEMDCLIIMIGLINLNITSCEKSLRYDRNENNMNHGPKMACQRRH